MRLKSWGTNIALAVVSFAVALGAAEVAIRLMPELLPPDVKLRLHWDSIAASKTTSIADPYIGFVYPANYEGRMAHSEVAFTYHTDEHGFRNTSSPSEPVDIVVLGDSLAFSYGVDDAQAWPKLLGDDLGLQVVNLGLIGASPQQYLRVYRKFGRGLEARLTIVCVFPGNDVTDEGLFMDWLDAGGNGNYDVWRFFGGGEPSSRFRFRSYLWSLLRKHIQAVRYRYDYAPETLRLADGGKLNLTPNVIARGTENTEIGNPLFEHAMDSIEQTVEQARADGSAALVLLVPTKEEVYLPLEEKPTPEPLAVFRKALEDRGIRYLDVTPALQSEARNGRRLYFTIDGHPNAAGYRIIADAVGDYIADHDAGLGR